MKLLIEKILMLVLLVGLVGCSDELENINPTELQINNTEEINQKGDKATKEIKDITDSIIMRYEKKIAGLSKEERDIHFKYTSELANNPATNVDELVKAMGFKSIKEFERVINSLKFQISILEENNSDFKNMDYHEKLNHFNANSEISVMGFNCAGEYNSCKTSADNNFTVAAVGCVVAGAGTLITAGCLWLSESLHESAVLNCRADYMICTMN